MGDGVRGPFFQQCIDAIVVGQIPQRCQPIDIPTTHPFIVWGVIFILSWEELWREEQKGARGRRPTFAI
jgi:hypothetical protein